MHYWFQGKDNYTSAVSYAFHSRSRCRTNPRYRYWSPYTRKEKNKTVC